MNSPGVNQSVKEVGGAKHGKTGEKIKDKTAEDQDQDPYENRGKAQAIGEKGMEVGIENAIAEEDGKKKGQSDEHAPAKPEMCPKQRFSFHRHGIVVIEIRLLVEKMKDNKRDNHGQNAGNDRQIGQGVDRVKEIHIPHGKTGLRFFQKSLFLG